MSPQVAADIVRLVDEFSPPTDSADRVIEPIDWQGLADVFEGTMITREADRRRLCAWVSGGWLVVDDDGWHEFVDDAEFSSDGWQFDPAFIDAIKAAGT